MGMFDNVKSDYDLPEALPGVRYQTKSFGDGYVGGFMDDYTITKEGKLIFHNTTYEVVPEEERPYWGKPEWKKNPLMQVCGSMRVASVKDEELDFHGIINTSWLYSKFHDLPSSLGCRTYWNAGYFSYVQGIVHKNFAISRRCQQKGANYKKWPFGLLN